MILFIAAALYSGVLLWRWARAGAAGRKRQWSLMGWFAGSVLADGVVGAVAWVARMQWFGMTLSIEDADSQQQRSATTTLSRRQFYNKFALEQRLSSIMYVCYGAELLCMIISKLLLLGRFASHAARNSKLQVCNIAKNRSSCAIASPNIRSQASTIALGASGGGGGQ